jgi:hypothetical protein
LLAAPCTTAVTIAAGVAGVASATLAQTPEGPLLTYRTTHVQQTNPLVIAGLIAAGAAIVSVTCTNATLEDVYATVVTGAPGRTASTRQ